MTTLADVSLNKVVVIDSVSLDTDMKRRMQDLGMIEGSKIAVVNHSGSNSIVLLHSSRVAIDQGLLQKINVKDVTEDENTWSSLDQMKVGEQGVVVNVHGNGAVKRRLMDMGITKGTALKVVKLAPLGDPLEIRIRGYELSLRKTEAEMVIITKEAE